MWKKLNGIHGFNPAAGSGFLPLEELDGRIPEVAPERRDEQKMRDAAWVG